MSELLNALIEKRKQDARVYQQYLEEIVEVTKKVENPSDGASYPTSLDSPAKRALYDNLGRNEARALDVDRAVRRSRQDDWRSNPLKIRMVKLAIKPTLQGDEQRTDGILELVKNQREY